MIGLVYSALCGLSLVNDKIKESTSDYRSLEHALKGNEPQYVDYNGNLRSTRNNHQIFCYRDNNGDYIRKDLKTGSMFNVDAEKRNYNRILAAQEHKTVYPTFLSLSDIYEAEKRSSIKGARFQDLQTGSIYVKRELKVYFCRYKELQDMWQEIKNYPRVMLYMDLDLHFIRPTDEEIALNRNIDYNKLINYLNKRNEIARDRYTPDKDLYWNDYIVREMKNG